MNIPDSVFQPLLLARKNNSDPIFRSLKKNLRQACDHYLDPQSPQYIDYQERQADWWLTRPGIRVLPEAIEALAVGGILLDDRYTEQACNILRTIVEHRIVENCAGTNYGRPYNTWRDNCLDAGISSGLLAMDLDLLRPVLSEKECEQFGTYCLPFIDYLLDDPPDAVEERPDWNMAAIGLSGMGMLALVLRSYGVLDEDRFSRAIEVGKRRCNLFLEKGHDGTGAFYEGPSYGAASLHFMAPFMMALARCGDRELIEHPGWQLIVQGLVYELIPTTGRPNILNDCNDDFLIEWLALVASEQKSGLAQWLWQSIDHPPTDGSFWQPPDSGWKNTVTRYLLFYDPSVEPVSPDDLELSKSMHFPNRGLVDVRSGWQPDDFFFSFLCDVFPAGGHRQADRNQFALHTLGEAFAIDSGYAMERLPDTTQVLRLGALGEAHNLPLIVGEMQRMGPVTNDGIQQVDLQSPAPYIASEAGESYLSASRFLRRATCLPNEDGSPAAVVIADWLDIEKVPGWPMLSWLLHTDAGNKLELSRDRVTIIGGRHGNRCDVQIITPGPGRWKQETFFDHPRLRYDWFWRPLFCIVALVPYRDEETAPEIATTGSIDGCGLTIRRGDVTDTFLAAAPECSVTFNETETDAEFAHVRTKGGAVETHRLAAGSRLVVCGTSLT